MKMYILLLAVIFAAGVAAPGADDVWAPQRLASPELLAEAGRVDRLEALTQRLEAVHVSPDERTARIRARLLQMGGPAGGEGAFISGIHENSSVDEGGTWKLSGMDLDYVWTAPQIALTKEFPPDRPLRGSIAAPLPKVHTVPFHYTNPVSGRVPPLLLPQTTPQ